jgi:hypothetical protein
MRDGQSGVSSDEGCNQECHQRSTDAFSCHSPQCHGHCSACPLWKRTGMHPRTRESTMAFLETASPGGCRQNVAFQYSREIECHAGSRACGERGAMVSTCMQSRDRVRWLAYHAQARLHTQAHLHAARLAPLVAEAMEFTDGLGRPVARPLQGQPQGDHLTTAVLHPKSTSDEQRARVLGAPRESSCARLEVHDARVGYLMREALKPSQRQSEAIKGNQRQSGSSGGVPDEGGIQMPSRYHQHAIRSIQMVRTTLGWATEWYRASGL